MTDHKAAPHVHTDECGFDRNGSIAAGHYVCMCGWESVDEKAKGAPYRKKPVVIEAIEWRGNNLREVIGFTGWHESASSKWTWEEYEQVVREKGLKIFTLEGSHMASVGDWIIRGVKGEFYPCKPDIFEATYEPASSTPQTAERVLSRKELSMPQGKSDTDDPQSEPHGTLRSPETSNRQDSGAAPVAGMPEPYMYYTDFGEGLELVHKRETATGRVYVAVEDYDALRAALEAARELERMRLAAISCAALQNTRQSEPPLAKDHPYWTPSYQDVLSAVGREIEWRERAEQAESESSRLRQELEDAVSDYKRVSAILTDTDAAGWKERATQAERDRDLLAGVVPLLKRYRNETPLGHQPHMIAHEVDVLLDAAIDAASKSAGEK